MSPEAAPRWFCCGRTPALFILVAATGALVGCAPPELPVLVIDVVTEEVDADLECDEQTLPEFATCDPRDHVHANYCALDDLTGDEPYAHTYSSDQILGVLHIRYSGDRAPPVYSDTGRVAQAESQDTRFFTVREPAAGQNPNCCNGSCRVGPCDLLNVRPAWLDPSVSAEELAETAPLYSWDPRTGEWPLEEPLVVEYRAGNVLLRETHTRVLAEERPVDLRRHPGCCAQLDTDGSALAGLALLLLLTRRRVARRRAV